MTISKELKKTKYETKPATVIFNEEGYAVAAIWDVRGGTRIGTRIKTFDGHTNLVNTPPDAFQWLEDNLYI